jgi:surface antigen/peptidoglycan hydrolase CwlO-like protein
MIKALMLRQKMKKSSKISLGSLLRPVYITLLIAVLGLGMGLRQPVRADSVSDQINALQQQNAANNNAVANLQNQATSYQDAINQLQAAISALQIQIDANQAQQADLQNQINAAQAQLDQQKALLGDDIRQMYLEGQTTTLEMLASIKNLSDFVDKQQYRNSVQDKITNTLHTITDLKHQLSDKKQQVEALLATQQSQQAQQQASRNEQASLLSYNQDQQAAFNQQTRNNQSKIDALIASQRKANFSPDGGYYFIHFPGNVGSFNPSNYAYANSGFGMSPGPGCVDNDGPDRWGYCTRQCVSYAAWAVRASGRSSDAQISGWGNARDWVAAAYARGIPVSRTPQAGDIAISTSGYWGHAMYVESVSGGRFNTSEYNTYLTGQLSYQSRSY